MSNIADLIEEYILRRLAEQQNGKVELRRTDIADEISCAPSQISYVLSTRFTQDKGFVVESRRGLGGFIRIVQVPLQNLIYQDMLGKVNEETQYAEVQSFAIGKLTYMLELKNHTVVIVPKRAFADSAAQSKFEHSFKK